MSSNTPRTLLVVEDVKATRMLVKAVLEKEGFTVLQAENGAEAVALFEQARPDAVLMDVMMPVMDGFEATRQIRDIDRDEGTPIIMLTGAEDIEAIERAFDVGATDFITKPINWPLLSQRVRYGLRSGQLLREVRQNRIRRASAQRIAQLGFWNWHPETDTLSWSEGVECMLGESIQPIDTLSKFLERVHKDDRERVARIFHASTSANVRVELELRFIDKQEESIFRLIGERGVEGRDMDQFFGAIQNVTESRRTEVLVDYLAMHDELTGLGNRRLFSQSAHKRLTRLRRTNDKLLVIGWLDLLRFHRHNDAMGEKAGDALLTQVAQRLRMLAIDGEVARVGGDEFAILIEANTLSDATIRLEHVVEGLDHAFKVMDQETFLTCSSGFACYPDDGQDADTLLTLAQEAQRQARLQGRRILRSGESVNITRTETLVVERALRMALKKNEFHLVYQPQMNLREGRIVGVEALLRWHHPERGLISPIEFVPILEESGQIIDVGAWVIQEACRQAQRWVMTGTPLRVGVNLSARQFHDPNLLETIVDATASSGISPENIELEITESLAMQNPEHAIQLLRQLQAMGYKIAIDDFGIGYSSLEYLLRFPLDTIKIDRAFVSHIIHSQADRAIVRAITAIAQTLGCSTIAEGIEELRQCDFIEALGVSEIQGYLIGKPMRCDELEMLIPHFKRPGID